MLLKKFSLLYFLIGLSLEFIISLIIIFISGSIFLESLSLIFFVSFILIGCFTEIRFDWRVSFGIFTHLIEDLFSLIKSSK
jgi:hypothetical protein